MSAPSNLSAIEVQRCRACGKLMVPPAVGCFRCGASDLETTAVAASGSLYTFTKIWVAPAGREDEAPYTVAVVELSGGLLLPSRIAEGRDDDLAIGQQVRLAGRDEHGYIFEPME
ncbi:MAG TPA: OB-fold domain-containing protein [Dehalococcoidia bacterium]|nr:OB-fold domain-containing protein [Dehalococcoidia bacterium]